MHLYQNILEYLKSNVNINLAEGHMSSQHNNYEHTNLKTIATHGLAPSSLIIDRNVYEGLQ